MRIMKIPMAASTYSVAERWTSANDVSDVITFRCVDVNSGISLKVLVSFSASASALTFSFNNMNVENCGKFQKSSGCSSDLLTRKSNLNRDLRGTSSMTPVTVYVFSGPQGSLIVSDFPRGSALPKYLREADLVRTIEFARDNAVSGFPLTKGNVKVLRKAESAVTMLFSKYDVLVPFS